MIALLLVHGATSEVAPERWTVLPVDGQVTLEPTRATIDAPRGQPVLLPFAGRVVTVREAPVAFVEIAHGDGFTTRFGHLEHVTVTLDENVAADQIIGRVGAGGSQTGPHIHIQLLRSGKEIDPAGLFPTHR